jgi:hypothetical protein
MNNTSLKIDPWLLCFANSENNKNKQTTPTKNPLHYSHLGHTSPMIECAKGIRVDHFWNTMAEKIWLKDSLMTFSNISFRF